MKRFVLSFALIVGLLASASTMQAQVNMSRSYLYVLDRLVIGVAIGTTFIRLGNLMNSEVLPESKALSTCCKSSLRCHDLQE